jgi:hypothetical protein
MPDVYVRSYAMIAYVRFCCSTLVNRFVIVVVVIIIIITTAREYSSEKNANVYHFGKLMKHLYSFYCHSYH